MARLAEDCGLQAVALHPRTRAARLQPVRPTGRASPRSRLRSRFPSSATADIVTPRGCPAHVRETGCDAVMIGTRGISNPWIFPRSSSTSPPARTTSPPSATATTFDAPVLPPCSWEQNQKDTVGKMSSSRTYFTHACATGRTCAPPSIRRRTRLRFSIWWTSSSKVRQGRVAEPGRGSGVQAGRRSRLLLQ